MSLFDVNVRWNPNTIEFEATPSTQDLDGLTGYGRDRISALSDLETKVQLWNKEKVAATRTTPVPTTAVQSAAKAFARISHSTNDVVVIVIEKEELDIYSAAEFRQVLNVEQDKHRRDIVLDLHLVTYLDSSTLGTLVSVVRQQKIAGRQLALVSMVGYVRRAFTITGLDRIFSTYDSVEHALKSMNHLVVTR